MAVLAAQFGSKGQEGGRQAALTLLHAPGTSVVVRQAGLGEDELERLEAGDALLADDPATCPACSCMDVVGLCHAFQDPSGLQLTAAGMRECMHAMASRVGAHSRCVRRWLSFKKGNRSLGRRSRRPSRRCLATLL